MTEPLLIGVANVDITPAAGLPMAGFVARTGPALDAHDSLTARAIVVGDTAIIALDVLGVSLATSLAIARRCALPEGNVIVAATHTHGGPQVLASCLPQPDVQYLAMLEDAAVAAIDRAYAERQPCTLRFGLGGDPAIARNRRHAGGVTDTTLPVIEAVDLSGKVIANLLAYACHPVVLAADNRLWTADYPGYVRRAMEAARPGATTLFLTGCTGDANTGHSAHASITLTSTAERSFETAERLGHLVAEKALAAELTPLSSARVGAESRMVHLPFARRETLPLPQQADLWREELQSAEGARRALLECWINWAETHAEADISGHVSCRVTAMVWGGIEIIALPGEIFAETAHWIRQQVANPAAIIIGFADDNPGYIPPRSEYPFGGYEVDEAHRYYGQPASFAPGAAEALATAAVDCVLALRASNR
jgi:neutral ceramidase